MLVCNAFWGTFESCRNSVKALRPLSSLRSLRPPDGLRPAGGEGFTGIRPLAFFAEFEKKIIFQLSFEIKELFKEKVEKKPIFKSKM